MALDPVKRKSGNSCQRMMCVLGAALLMASLPGRAIDLDLDTTDVERLLQVARGREADRARFHAGYTISVNHPSVEAIEVITESRRLVLLAEEGYRAGDRTLVTSPRAREQALEPWRRRVALVARVRFPPLNTYLSTPAVDVTLGVAPESVLARSVRRDEILAQPAKDQTMGRTVLGVVVEALFDAEPVAQARRPVIVWLGSREVLRVDVDFSQMP